MELALDIVEEFARAATELDRDAYEATVNFPHVLISKTGVEIWPDVEALWRHHEPRIRALREKGWHRSVYESKEIVQRDESKFHIAVTFTRLDATGAPLGRFQALYIVTCLDGHWGVQARSNFV
jgi:hypothetical protein